MTKKLEKELTKDFNKDVNDVKSILSDAATRVALKKLVTGSVVAQTSEEFDKLIADETKNQEEPDVLIREHLAKNIIDENKNIKTTSAIIWQNLFRSLVRKKIRARNEKQDDIAKLYKVAFIKSQK